MKPKISYKEMQKNHTLAEWAEKKEESQDERRRCGIKKTQK